MAAETDHGSTARDRIRLAYDPNLMRTAGERLMEQLATHLAEVQSSSGRVLNWAPPTENIARAAHLADAAIDPVDPTELISHFETLVREMLSRGHNLHDPRYVGHQVPAPIPLAGLFDAVGSVTNQVMAVYEMGPWSTAVEQAMVAKLAGFLGWRDGNYAGFVTHGGSLANLNALLVARNVALGDCWENGVAGSSPVASPRLCGERPGVKGDFGERLAPDINQPTDEGFSSVVLRPELNLEEEPITRSPLSRREGTSQAPRSNAAPVLGSPVIVVQADAHYSISRAAGILGLGTKHVVKVGLDERRRMDVAELDRTLTQLKSQGHPIVAVVACSCSTPIGAFDRLNDVADVCEKHGVWLHVDAAHGGSALLSERHRSLVAGLERADSLVWDAHKMMFVPALCAFLFFKQKRHSYAAFQQNAPYLFDPSSLGMAEYDVGLRTFECTKRAAVYGLWGVWSLFGPQLFADLVDVTFELGQQFYQKLLAAPDFTPLHEPQCNIVTFRHVPLEMLDATPERLGEFQRTLRRTVIESGEFYLVATNLNGVDALRVTLINPLTTVEHLDQLLDTLRRQGRHVLSNMSQPKIGERPL
jgi:glutamate/tyrosine decarboxylase-like PLP-dependent enzyme